MSKYKIKGKSQRLNDDKHIMKRKAIFYVILGCLIFIAGQGCVTRAINIETSPSNASVYIDDKYVGESPVSVPFTHYGTRKITIEKRDDEGRLIFKKKVSYEKIKPPIYEIFPLDFFSEIVLPLKMEDNHYYNYQLEEMKEIPIAGRKKQVLKNAEELRKKALMGM